MFGRTALGMATTHMNSPLTEYCKRVATHVWLASVVLSGVLTVIYDQASSPNYWMLLGVAGTYLSIHAMLAIPYIIRTRTRSRWVAMAVFVLTSLSYLEMTLRVWCK